LKFGLVPDPFGSQLTRLDEERIETIWLRSAIVMIGCQLTRLDEERIETWRLESSSRELNPVSTDPPRSPTMRSTSVTKCCPMKRGSWSVLWLPFRLESKTRRNSVCRSMSVASRWSATRGRARSEPRSSPGGILWRVHDQPGDGWRPVSGTDSSRGLVRTSARGGGPIRHVNQCHARSSWNIVSAVDQACLMSQLTP
jgi:hypothetical protein